MPAKSPGDCVYIDTMESRTPGFVAQLKGKLTTRRHKHATVFKDHYSDLTYVHLHEINDGESIVIAKQSFEVCTRKHNITIKHYHAAMIDSQIINSLKT